MHLFIHDEEANQPQQDALAHIAEHHAEQDGVGDADKKRWVQIAITRQAVHFYKHLERAREPVVLQLYRRGVPGQPGVHARGLIAQQAHARHALKRLFHFLQARRGHIPADIIGMIQQHHIAPHAEHLGLIVQPQRHLTQKLQIGRGGHIGHLGKRIALGRKLLLLADELGNGVLGGAVHKIGHPEPFEEQRGENGIHCLGVLGRHKIHAPVKFAVKVILAEGERAVLVIGQLHIAVLRQAAKAHLQELAAENFIHGGVKARQVIQLLFCLLARGNARIQLCHALAAFGHLCGKFFHRALHLVKRKGALRRCLRFRRRLAQIF